MPTGSKMLASCKGTSPERQPLAEPLQVCIASSNNVCPAALQGPKMLASREGACTPDQAEAAFGEVLQRLRDLGPHIHQWAMPLEHLILRLEELAIGRWPPPAENRPGVAQHAAVVDSLVVVSAGRGRGVWCAQEVSVGQKTQHNKLCMSPLCPVRMLQQCCQEVPSSQRERAWSQAACSWWECPGVAKGMYICVGLER